jgi:hypothetical protein
MTTNRKLVDFSVLRVGWLDPHQQTKTHDRGDDLHCHPSAHQTLCEVSSDGEEI